MSSILLLKPQPQFQSPTQHHPLKLRPTPLFFPKHHPPCPPRLSFRIHNSTTKNPSNSKTSKTHSFSHTFHFLKPYLLSQRKPILCAWLCSAISVYSLSNLLSKFSKFSAVTASAAVDAPEFRNQSFVLGALVTARLVASYGQHALLWEAALNAVYELRVHVFDRVLQRELGFFEAKDGASAGDIAYRITAEASDVADTLYAVLNTVVPSTLQLSAMMMQMLVISPVLSLISAMVIPCMALVVAILGQELRKISREAHLSIAALSAYLNEMLPAILFVKANNAEMCESARFKRLAQIDYAANLNKKRMKAVIPQVIQAIYFGILSILCVGSMLISRGSFDGYRLVSFVTSLLFLIEPIQVLLCVETLSLHPPSFSFSVPWFLSSRGLELSS